MSFTSIEQVLLEHIPNKVKNVSKNKSRYYEILEHHNRLDNELSKLRLNLRLLRNLVNERCFGYGVDDPICKKLEHLHLDTKFGDFNGNITYYTLTGHYKTDHFQFVCATNVLTESFDFYLLDYKYEDLYTFRRLYIRNIEYRELSNKIELNTNEGYLTLTNKEIDELITTMHMFREQAKYINDNFDELISKVIRERF